MLESVPISLKRMDAFRVAYVTHEGPWEDVGLSFLELVRLLRTRRVRASGPFMAFHDREPSKGSVPSRFTLAVPVPADTKGGRGLAVRDLPAGEVAAMIYDGPPARLQEAFPVLDRWMKDHGYVRGGPIREIYAPDLSDVPPGIIHVEVHIPVRTRKEIRI